MITAGLAGYQRARQIAAEVSETAGDVAAEVQAEREVELQANSKPAAGEENATVSRRLEPVAS
jgi:predicted nucleic acid-binding Zn ribbon protein